MPPLLFPSAPGSPAVGSSGPVGPEVGGVLSGGSGGWLVGGSLGPGPVGGGSSLGPVSVGGSWLWLGPALRDAVGGSALCPPSPAPLSCARVRVPPPLSTITASTGLTRISARQPCPGARPRTTCASTVTDSPRSSRPACSLSRTQSAPVASPQSSGARPVARSVIRLVPPRVRTVMASPEAPARCLPPGSTTVAESGAPASWALPAFSYGSAPAPSLPSPSRALTARPPSGPSSRKGRPPPYEVHSARSGAATTVATTVDVTARERSRSRRAARSRASSGKPLRSRRNCAAPLRRLDGTAVGRARISARGAVRTGSASGVTAVPGHGSAAPARSAVRRQRGHSSTWRTSSPRSAEPSGIRRSPAYRAATGQPPLAATPSATRVRSTSHAAAASSSRAALASRPITEATWGGVSSCRTASSSASRCSGLVPAASGQASRASSLRRSRPSADSSRAPSSERPRVSVSRRRHTQRASA
ncbi:hypothetical protein [Streptomyces sp. CLI2509]|uniref:hypothetical protein n=1 Tax=Streptomyces sp. CLI2509 TaxID=1984801 RepID=UPI00131EA385|nr:hypothetical protein [Streptomyces sp. CLI2509]